MHRGPSPTGAPAPRRCWPPIRAELQRAEAQFRFFDAALRTLRPGQGDAQAMGHVVTTSERILQVMDNVTGMFARIT